MEALMLALLSAIAGLIIAVVSGSLAYYFARRRENEARRRELALQRLRDQIEEFYGPLWGLLQYSKTIHDLARTTIFPNKHSDGGFDLSLFDDRDWAIWTYLLNTQFIPINTKVAQLLYTKGYLGEHITFPPSYEEFLRHYVQIEVLHRLNTEAGYFIENAPSRPWPPQFNADVNKTYDSLNKQFHQQRESLTKTQYTEA